MAAAVQGGLCRRQWEGEAVQGPGTAWLHLQLPVMRVTEDQAYFLRALTGNEYVCKDLVLAFHPVPPALAFALSQALGSTDCVQEAYCLRAYAIPNSFYKAFWDSFHLKYCHI